MRRAPRAPHQLGRDQRGRSRPGRTQPGRTQPGRDQPGRDQFGRNLPGHRTLLAAALVLLLVMPLHVAAAQTGTQGAGWAAAPSLTVQTGAAPVCPAHLLIAISASSPAAATRAAELDRRQAELRLVELGLGASVSMKSGTSLGANLARTDEASWSPLLELDAAFEYQYDELALTRARIALLTAERRLEAQVRNDVLQALITLSRARVAGPAIRTAEVAAAAAEELAAAALASARTSLGLDDGATIADVAAASPEVALDVRELSLAAARARATADARNGDLDDALAELARLSIDPSAAGAAALTSPHDCLPAGWQLAEPDDRPGLPTVTAERSSERRLLELQRDLAAVQHSRAVLAPVRDVAITGQYQEGGTRVTASVGVDSGKPGAGVALRWRASSAHAWSVGVAGTFKIDTSYGRDVTMAAEQLLAAEGALLEFDRSLADREAAEREALAVAWRTLTFALEAHAIAAERAAAATDEREVARTEVALQRAADALERDYQAYLRALNRWLAAFDLTWGELL